LLKHSEKKKFGGRMTMALYRTPAFSYLRIDVLRRFRAEFVFKG